MRLLLAVFFALHPGFVLAETSSSSSSSSGSGQGEALPGGTVVEVPEQPQVIPGTPPKAPDRQKSSAMAKAMLLGGQAQSMIMCMQMQQEAMKQGNSTDKALMMMMANQACQQAAEMGKAAAEADKGQKAVSQEDIPKQSQLKLGAQKLPSGSAKEDTSAMSGYKIINDEEASKGEDIPAGKAILPDLGVGEQKKVAAAATPTPALEAQAKEVPDLGRSVPGVVPGQKVSMSEADKTAGLNAGSGMPMGPNLAGLGPSLAASGKSPAEEAKNLKNSGGEEEGRAIKASAAETGEGGGGGGGSGGSASGEKGPDPFEAMLAQLLGGPPEGGGGGSGEDVVLAPRGEGKPPNIFEYATFRYVKLVDQKKLKGGKAEAPGNIGSRDKKGPDKLAPAEAAREPRRAPASSGKLSKR